MTFEGQYLTYTQFLELGGAEIGEMPFNLLEFEARRKIDVKTFNRIKDLDGVDIPQEVQLCEYNLINTIKNYATSTSNASSSGNVASENIDGYSISYITSDKISEIVKSKSAELDDIIRTYLLNVIVNDEHVLYCGVDNAY